MATDVLARMMGTARSNGGSGSNNLNLSAMNVNNDDGLMIVKKTKDKAELPEELLESQDIKNTQKEVQHGY